MLVKQGGEFKRAQPLVRVGGQWVYASTVYVNVGGVWKQSFPSLEPHWYGFFYGQAGGAVGTGWYGFLFNQAHGSIT